MEKSKNKLYYVYILHFSDGLHLKIGKSSESKIRMRKLHDIYNFDLSKCVRIKCNKKSMDVLEKHLKVLTKDFNCTLFESNGKTEIRNIECLPIIDKYFKENSIIATQFSTFLRNFLAKPKKKRTIVKKEKETVIKKKFDF